MSLITYIIYIPILIYELATADSYSKIRNEGEYTTLFYLEQILRLMEDSVIELPKYNDLVKFEFNVNCNDGLGERIGKEYSLILNN